MSAFSFFTVTTGDELPTFFHEKCETCFSEKLCDIHPVYIGDWACYFSKGDGVRRVGNSLVFPSRVRPADEEKLSDFTTMIKFINNLHPQRTVADLALILKTHGFILQSLEILKCRCVAGLCSKPVFEQKKNNRTIVAITTTPFDREGYLYRVPYIESSLFQDLKSFPHVDLMLNRNWTEIKKAILETNPEIVHIIGHTNEDGFLWMEGKIVSSEDFKNLNQKIILFGNRTSRFMPLKNFSDSIVTIKDVSNDVIISSILEFHHQLDKTCDFQEAYEKTFFSSNQNSSSPEFEKEDEESPFIFVSFQ
jgi:hypothetical protein